jgi:hypothetical protein
MKGMFTVAALLSALSLAGCTKKTAEQPPPVAVAVQQPTPAPVPPPSAEDRTKMDDLCTQATQWRDKNVASLQEGIKRMTFPGVAAYPPTLVWQREIDRIERTRSEVCDAKDLSTAKDAAETGSKQVHALDIQGIQMEDNMGRAAVNTYGNQ